MSVKNHGQLPRSFAPFFWHFVKQQPFSFALFFAAPLVQILEVTAIPFTLKMIIDSIEQGDKFKATIFSQIAPALWLFAFCWLVIVIFSRIQEWWQAYAIPVFQANIRSTVFDYLSNHSFKFFSDNLSGNLASKVSDLARAALRIHYIICWNIIASTAVILTSLIVIIEIAPIFAVILLIWFFSILLLVIGFSSKINSASSVNAEDKSMLTGTIVDILSNITAVKLFSRRNLELEYFKRLQEKEKSSYKKMVLTLNFHRIFLDLATLLMLAFLIYYLISEWQNNNISSGDFVFIFNVNIGIMNVVWYLAEALPELFSEIGVLNQALTMINHPHEVVDIVGAKQLEVKQGEIKFEKVTFGYKQDQNIFLEKNLLIEAGQKVGLVGFSGSGKTSFVNLILRFFDIKSGRITIDTQNIAEVTQESLRSNISVIPQDTPLFHRSLMENIRYGKPEATDGEVVEAAKSSHCHEFIDQLPDKYQTLVGERGIKLSGGQRQRIAIARSMLKNAPILILDEATSALDSITEKLIQDSIQTLIKNKTTIVIAHRLSTLAKMDRILVFNKGEIIEDGSHSELIKVNGQYAKMWHMQAGGFLPETDG